MSQICACAVDSGTNFKCCICDLQWNSRKLGGSPSRSSTRYLNAFRLLQEKKSASRRSRTYRITRGAQLTGRLGRLSNGGISTIPNKTNPSAHTIFLMSEDKEALCHWLCISLLEVRKECGDPYTPRSIVQLMSGLNHKISSDGSGVNIIPIELLLIHSSYHLSYFCCFCIQWLVTS